MKLSLPSATIAAICFHILSTAPHSTIAFSISSTKTSTSTIHAASTYFTSSTSSEQKQQQKDGGGDNYLNSLNAQNNILQHTSRGHGLSSYIDNLASSSTTSSSASSAASLLNAQELAALENQVEEKINKASIEASIEAQVENGAVNFANSLHNKNGMNNGSSSNIRGATLPSATGDYFSTFNNHSTSSAKSFSIPSSSTTTYKSNTGTTNFTPSSTTKPTETKNYSEVERQVEKEVSSKVESKAEAAVEKGNVVLNAIEKVINNIIKSKFLRDSEKNVEVMAEESATLAVERKKTVHDIQEEYNNENHSFFSKRTMTEGEIKTIGETEESAASQPKKVQTSTTSLFNLSSGQLSSFEKQGESKSNYQIEETKPEQMAILDVESTAENLVASDESSNSYFGSASAKNVPVAAATSYSTSPNEIKSIESKVENDLARYRAYEIEAERKVEREIELTAERMVEMAAADLAEGKKTINEVSNMSGSTSQLFVSSKTVSSMYYEESKVNEKPAVVENPPVPSSKVEQSNQSSPKLSEKDDIDLRALELAAEAKVIADIERAAERIVEQGAASLAEGKKFDSTTKFAGSTKSTYFSKPSTTDDNPAIKSLSPLTTSTYFKKPTVTQSENARNEVTTPIVSSTSSASSLEIYDAEILESYKENEIAAEALVVKEAEASVEKMVESKAAAETTTTKTFRDEPMMAKSSGSYLDALSSTKNASTSGSGQSSYLDALSRTNSASTSGSGQSSYLDALQSRNAPSASGSGLNNYVDNISPNESIAFTQSKPSEIVTPNGNYLDALAGSGSSLVSGSGMNGYLDALQTTNAKSSHGSAPSSYLDSIGASKPYNAPLPGTDSLSGKRDNQEGLEVNTVTVEGCYVEGVKTTSVCKLGIDTGRPFTKTYVQNSLLAMRQKSELRDGKRTDLKLYMSSPNSNNEDIRWNKRWKWKAQDIKKPFEDVELEVNNISGLRWDPDDIKQPSNDKEKRLKSNKLTIEEANKLAGKIY